MKDQSVKAGEYLQILHNYWGGGKIEAPLWFIGLEYGIPSNADVAQLIRACLLPAAFKSGTQERMNLPDRYWLSLFHIAQGFYGDSSQTRRQTPRLKRHILGNDPEIFLGEIYPLPRKKHSDWPDDYPAAAERYPSELFWLKDKKAYADECLIHRPRALAKKAAVRQDRRVIISLGSSREVAEFWNSFITELSGATKSGAEDFIDFPEPEGYKSPRLGARFAGTNTLIIQAAHTNQRGFDFGGCGKKMAYLQGIAERSLPRELQGFGATPKEFLQC